MRVQGSRMGGLGLRDEDDCLPSLGSKYMS